MSNHLDNDKEELKRELVLTIQHTPAEHGIYTILAEEITKRITPLIDQYTQSKLKAFAGEVEELLVDVEPNMHPGLLHDVQVRNNAYRNTLRESLKAIKERRNI